MNILKIKTILLSIFILLSCENSALLEPQNVNHRTESSLELITISKPAETFKRNAGEARTISTKNVSEGDVDEPMFDTLTDQQFVSYKNGGELIVEYKAEDFGLGDLSCKVTLKVFSETISEDSDLVLALNTSDISGNVDVAFSPHGITFSEPALLNIEAKEMDLTGVDPDKIGLYYDNEETRTWEKMKTKEIIVKLDEGYIKIIDGELPHFSRYAVAYGR